MPRLWVRIDGRVQGVGYRYFVQRRAAQHAITGWVKNRADGSIEIEAVGKKPALEEFLSYVRVGPPAANVSHAVARWFDEEPVYKGFDVRF